MCARRPDGMRWLPVQAVLGSASGAVFQIADLPVDGVVLDPCGPGAPRPLSLEQCERVARYRRG